MENHVGDTWHAMCVTHVMQCVNMHGTFEHYIRVFIHGVSNAVHGGSSKEKEEEGKREGEERRKGGKEKKMKEEKRGKKEKEERERKEEKERVSRSEQTRKAKNPELRYKR